jgi:hypothetical protein
MTMERWEQPLEHRIASAQEAVLKKIAALQERRASK